VAGLSEQKRAARGTLHAKSVPPVAHFGVESVPPVAQVVNVTRFVFPPRNQCAVPRCATGGPIRGENLPFPCDLPSAYSASVRKGHPREEPLGGQRSIRLATGARPTVVQGRSSAILTRTPVQSSSPNCLLPTLAAGNQAPAISPQKGPRHD
jgi:hypothetical protein